MTDLSENNWDSIHEINRKEHEEIYQEISLRRAFKNELVNDLINSLLKLMKEEWYEDLSKEFMIEEFFHSLEEILADKEGCTRCIKKIFENDL